MIDAAKSNPSRGAAVAGMKAAKSRATRGPVTTCSQRIHQAAAWLPAEALQRWLLRSRTSPAEVARQRIGSGDSFIAAVAEGLAIQPSLARHLVRQGAEIRASCREIELAGWEALLLALDGVAPSQWPRKSECWQAAHEALNRLDSSAPLDPVIRLRLAQPILAALHQPDIAKSRLELRLALIDRCCGHHSTLLSLSLLGEAALARMLALVDKSPFVAVPLEWRATLTARGRKLVQAALDGAFASGLRARLLADAEAVTRWGDAVGNCLASVIHQSRYIACCPVMVGVSKGNTPVLTVAYTRQQAARRGRLALRVADWQWCGDPNPEARAGVEAARVAIEAGLSGQMHRCLQAPLSIPITDIHPIRLWRALIAEIDLRAAEALVNGELVDRA
jgi:hypothetical protein